MHSRVYELSLYPTVEEEYIDCGDVSDDSSFVGPIADYTSNECDRQEDINWFIELYGTHGVEYIEKENCFVFKEGFKEKYFQDAWDKINATVTSMTLETFSSDSNAIYTISKYTEDKFGIYIFFDHAETLDSFVRDLEYNTKYYIGGTVDYHY